MKNILKEFGGALTFGLTCTLGIFGCWASFNAGVDYGKLEVSGGAKDWCDYEYHLNIQEEHGKLFYWVHDVEADVDILRGGEGIQSVEDAIIKTNL